MPTEIPLTRGYAMKCDPADYPALAKRSWRPDPANLRALTHVRRNGVWTTITPHRLLLDVPRGSVVVHVNYDSFDYSRLNMQVVPATVARKRTPRPVRGRPGVYYSKSAGVWVSYRRDEKGCRRFLGVFPTADAAEAAYLQAAGNAMPDFLVRAFSTPKVRGSMGLMRSLAALASEWKFAPGTGLAERLWEHQVERVLELETALAAATRMRKATPQPARARAVTRAEAEVPLGA